MLLFEFSVQSTVSSVMSAHTPYYKDYYVGKHFSSWLFECLCVTSLHCTALLSPHKDPIQINTKLFGLRGYTKTMHKCLVLFAKL